MLTVQEFSLLMNVIQVVALAWIGRQAHVNGIKTDAVQATVKNGGDYSDTSQDIRPAIHP
jgi:hypothetical protein